jgi:hypothetical protein
METIHFSFEFKLVGTKWKWIIRSQPKQNILKMDTFLFQRNLYQIVVWVLKSKRKVRHILSNKQIRACAMYNKNIKALKHAQLTKMLLPNALGMKITNII